MQFRQLRKLLQSIVAAGLPLAATSCLLDTDRDDNCVDERLEILHVAEPAEPALQLKIDQCRADADACHPLCSDAMERAGLPSNPSACDVRFGDDVQITVLYTVYGNGPGCPAEGRRPSGLATPSRLVAHSAAGAWLAQAAWLEAASVPAFLHLARELAHHGAPRTLVKLALAAAKDEVRHAAVMTQLAHRYGAEPPCVDVQLPGVRSLLELAIENAKEGCVRETWGAVIALWQASASSDLEVRRAFAAIAKDEIRHAALAWEIDAWLAPRLDAADRARVIAARDEAVAELFEGGELASIAQLGLPSGDGARALLTRTYNALWMGGLS